MYPFIPVLAQTAAGQTSASVWSWLIPTAIVVLGLLIFGFRDVMRLSFTRVWAISGVCFSESLRRRILLVTPLAVVGVLVVTQFQSPIDEQDAIRESLKFCLFSTGLVLVLTTIILACTSIPKEIETKVIFTIVTKPTTRLEIVLGKIVGFARVSATVLAIMGIFTWGFLGLRSWVLNGYITQRLASGVTLPPAEKALLEHFQANGLLEARSLAAPRTIAILAKDPGQSGNDRWMFGSKNQQCIVQFQLNDAQQWAAVHDGIYLSAAVKWEKYQDVKPSAIPTGGRTGFAITVPDGHPPFANATVNPPSAEIEVLDPDLNALISSQQLYVPPFPADPKKAPPTETALPLADEPDTAKTITVWIHPQYVESLTKNLVTSQKIPYFYVRVTGEIDGYRYGLDATHAITMTIRPPANGMENLGGKPGDIVVSPNLDQDNQPIITYRGQTAMFGQQIEGGGPASDLKLPLAAYTFRDTRSDAISADGNVSMEFTGPIDRVDAKVSEHDDPTNVDVTVRDLKNPSHEFKRSILVENRRTSFFDVPAEVVASGDFQVVLRDRTEGHYLCLLDDSLQVVTDRQPFAWNLAKSLLVLWMLSLLVVTISIFCSTFVSWPIAVVMTTIILLGHWTILMIGDQNAVGLGRQISRDFFASATGAQAHVIDTSVEKLTTMVNDLAAVLPDVSHFDATGNIEKGRIVGASALGEGFLVLAQFGLPLTVLGYLLMKIKEVAP
jgi:ABC-type transport system involved in multi-copper enzyme maturation permease subunit